MTATMVWRFVLRAWLLQLKMVTTTRIYLLAATFTPLIFATLGFHLLGGGIAVAFGSGLMGMWSAALLGSGAAIDRQRRIGILEPVVAAPMPLVLVVLPITMANATLGLISLSATLLWGWLLFDLQLDIPHPAYLGPAILATVLSIGLLGLVLAGAFVRYPVAQALSNLLEYPIWIVCGMLVPLDRLPAIVGWLSYPMAPAWGVRSIQESVIDGPAPITPLLVCLALTAVYAVLASLLVRWIERSARISASLALS